VDFYTIIIIVFAVLIILAALTRDRKPRRKHSESSAEVFDISEIYSIAAALEDFFNESAHPKDLLTNAEFERGAKYFQKSEFSNEELLSYANGENIIIACLAFEALRHRDIDDKTIDKTIQILSGIYLWSIFYALRVLEKANGQILGRVLAQAQEWWPQYQMQVQFFNDFIQIRIAGGEKPTLKGVITQANRESIGHISGFLNKLDRTPIENLFTEFDEIKSTLLDSDYLNSIGKIRTSELESNIIIEHPYLLEVLKQTEEFLFSASGRSVLLVGEPGVGKKALISLLVKSLGKKGWKLFEAGASEVIAGQKYIGELEARVQSLIENLDSNRFVFWYIPNFHQLHYAGMHRYSTIGILDMILPHIESGRLKIIAETHPSSNEKLSRDHKRVHSLLETIRMTPLSENATLKLVDKWVSESNQKQFNFKVEAKTLTEALHLSKQFLNNLAAPGNVFGLIKLAIRLVQINNSSAKRISPEDLYSALSQLTGLPRSILDDRVSLDLNALRAHFTGRVMGQGEAIECLVERVAMIKAALTDPTRPFGVFLFAGPTGTGKTEIAKALADFLFGSQDRMIRLDMSEFKTVESVDRILGETGERSDSSALVNQIRKQPFSVILLDEFEKAHPNIWDLFLQVFDDGRLSDKQGNTANFRHTIIILTSNLGATVQVGSSLGFNSAAGDFTITDVEKAITKTFRREFVNRLDRVVIFRPLSRSVMRTILHSELNQTLQRRGLRNREWAVEWEDSAVEFLLEKGFTPDLGARPLKRAIDRYLLSPLAMTIVNHQFPSGDQFLFVRSDGQSIQVEFIDPDAQVEVLEADTPVDITGDSDQTLRKIVLEPQLNQAETDFLARCYEELETTIRSEEWQNRKDDFYQKIATDDFWESTGRFQVLSNTEYMDRIESGLNTARSLTDRMRTKTVPQSIVRRLAQQLYLLGEACKTIHQDLPKDSFIRIESKPSPKTDPLQLHAIAEKLLQMYLNWAKLRNMKYTVLLKEKSVESHAFIAVVAFSGFGAYAILKGEAGIHIFEEPVQENRFGKYNVRVHVAPQPDIPVKKRSDLLHQAESAFNAKEIDKTIVRHYREKPSPLVKDSIGKWKTGKLSTVLAGNFDLFIKD
jgi:ATP-dependent Clp protease ATP-binding subunit ClpC